MCSTTASQPASPAAGHNLRRFVSQYFQELILGRIFGEMIGKHLRHYISCAHTKNNSGTKLVAVRIHNNGENFGWQFRLAISVGNFGWQFRRIFVREIGNIKRYQFRLQIWTIKPVTEI